MRTTKDGKPVERQRSELYVDIPMPTLQEILLQARLDMGNSLIVEKDLESALVFMKKHRKHAERYVEALSRLLEKTGG